MSVCSNKCVGLLFYEEMPSIRSDFKIITFTYEYILQLWAWDMKWIKVWKGYSLKKGLPFCKECRETFGIVKIAIRNEPKKNEYVEKSNMGTPGRIHWTDKEVLWAEGWPVSRWVWVDAVCRIWIFVNITYSF